MTEVPRYLARCAASSFQRTLQDLFHVLQVLLILTVDRLNLVFNLLKPMVQTIVSHSASNITIPRDFNSGFYNFYAVPILYPSCVRHTT